MKWMTIDKFIPSQGVFAFTWPFIRIGWCITIQINKITFHDFWESKNLPHLYPKTTPHPKFQNLNQIPLKICGVWKNLGVWLKTHSKFESSLKIWKLTQNFENSLKYLVNSSRGKKWLWRAKLQIIYIWSGLCRDVNSKHHAAERWDWEFGFQIP